jgi:hypothetical protein
MTLLLWLHQTNEYNGICCFSGYIKPMTMTLLLWLHQTNDYDEQRHSHWFDVTREATNTVIVIGLM